MNLLETTKLVKSYDGRVVVNQISFVVRQEEIVGILGRNGAGKTTTFRMIMGMIAPDSGAVALDGQDVTHLPMYKRALRGVGYLSQERSDFRRLTVWQNMQVVLETRSLRRSERIRKAEELLKHYDLLRLRNQRSETLSGGERRKLEICRALCTDPKLILLDEPFTGVDPLAVEELQSEIKRLRDEFRKSVLITEHKVLEALRICNRGVIIVDGEKIMDDVPQKIIKDQRVRAEYLGNTFRGDEFD
jgi:lipopolysaccharide export system ATP-binding protein